MSNVNGHKSQEPPAVGRVGCPLGQEANVDEFYFWIAPEQLVEQTQIVRVPTRMGGADVELFGVVEQVYRRSTISSMHMELAAHDGDPVADDLMLDRDGVTYAKVRVVNAFPPKLAPPIEGSTVFACSEREAERAYEMDTYADERGVCIGLIRNGGDSTAGRAFLDQDFLLGAQAGHLNVNGAAGSGTKSSFLTLAAYQTINALKARSAGMVGSGQRPRIKTFIFNVKGFDLFWLDRWSTKFNEDDARVWREMGVASPDVFRSIAYYAPETAQRSAAARAIQTERPGEILPYSWSLKDIIDFGLFDLLFSDETRANDNIVTLINWLSHRLSTGRSKAASLEERLGQAPDAARAARRQLTDTIEKAFNSKNELDNGNPILTFEELLNYIEFKAQPESKDLSDDSLRSMSNSTIQALWRRLARVLGPGFGAAAARGHRWRAADPGDDAGRRRRHRHPVHPRRAAPALRYRRCAQPARAVAERPARSPERDVRRRHRRTEPLRAARGIGRDHEAVRVRREPDAVARDHPLRRAAAGVARIGRRHREQPDAGARALGRAGAGGLDLAGVLGGGPQARAAAGAGREGDRGAELPGGAAREGAPAALGDAAGGADGHPTGVHRRRTACPGRRGVEGDTFGGGARDRRQPGGVRCGDRG